MQPGVSKDGPLVSECAAHPSRQAFGLPQDEVAGMRPGEGREGSLPGPANKKTALKPAPFSKVHKGSEVLRLLLPLLLRKLLHLLRCLLLLRLLRIRRRPFPAWRDLRRQPDGQLRLQNGQR